MVNLVVREPHYAAIGKIISHGQIMAKSGSQYGIRCNTVSAGLINSDGKFWIEFKIVQKAAENVIMKKLGDPEDVAKTVIFLHQMIQNILLREQYKWWIIF